jgi:signal transduction histidine kinase
LLEANLDPDDARRRRFIAAALNGCERASDLTKRLLSFVRREPVDPQPVDINEVITRMSDLAWHSLGDQITATSRLSRDLWPVFVDPNQLETALLNLALNARDAMPGGGRLTIETANRQIEEGDESHPGVGPGDYVAIAIGDTGIGMPQEVRDKAFDPFFTTKEAGKGTGLGLSQVNGFVTRFGGRCVIDSQPGRGTTVKLYLPRYSGAVEREDARSAAEASDDATAGDPVAGDGPADRNAANS